MSMTMTTSLMLPLYNFECLLNNFLLILDTFRPICNVSFQTVLLQLLWCSTVAFLLASYIINKIALHGGKLMWNTWRFFPITHCDVITLISDCIPLEVSLQLTFCKFSSNILKYGSNVLKTVAKITLRNPFSVYCNNVLEITYQCVQFNINECHSLIFKNWYYRITDEMSSIKH